MKEKKNLELNYIIRSSSGFLNNTLLLLDNTNLDIFNTMEILSQPDFKASINKAMNQGNNKNNTFKILIKENYSHYITSLKK